jgi:hypothetical protein
MKPAGDAPILLIWYIFCCLYGIFWLRCYYLDKKDTFEKYIINDLISHGLKLESSRFISKKPQNLFQGIKLRFIQHLVDQELLHLKVTRYLEVSQLLTDSVFNMNC